MTVSLKITPASGYILVEPTKTERKTASGIVLPDSHEEKPQKGKVLAVGGAEITESGVKREAPCKVGETVIYKEWGGNEYKEGEKEYLFIKFEDILGIVK
jgi:chaperonin GroES